MSSLFPEGPLMSPAEFRLIRDCIDELCGIRFQEDSKYLFERRVRGRLRSLGLTSFTEYYHYLRYHPKRQTELEAAVEALVTNETYFFREDYQLQCFRDELLPELSARLGGRARRQLNVWSAGCSTGEEVYTLAILIAESGLFTDWDLRIFGNDISRRVLAKARRAVYSGASFRSMPERYERYFHDLPEGRRVDERIRAMCHFGHLNLLDRERIALIGRVHVVFCRNVLIYLNHDARRQVVQTFYERLLPGGYLLLGHSESLLNASTAFELVHLSSDMVYRRPLSAIGPMETPSAELALPPALEGEEEEEP